MNTYIIMVFPTEIWNQKIFFLMINLTSKLLTLDLPLPQHITNPDEELNPTWLLRSITVLLIKEQSSIFLLQLLFFSSWLHSILHLERLLPMMHTINLLLLTDWTCFGSSIPDQSPEVWNSSLLSSWTLLTVCYNMNQFIDLRWLKSNAILGSKVLLQLNNKLRKSSIEESRC